MKFKLVLLSILVGSFGFAQSHKATIEKIQQDGFYKIQITPEVLSAAKNNLDFLRIQDKNNYEVPYVVHSDLNGDLSQFQLLEIISKTVVKDSISSFVINNYNDKDNGKLALVISNSKINKLYNLSGSNDQKEWFGLVANQMLTDLNNDNATVVEKTIFFPVNNYKFLKLDLIDKRSLPVNLINVGYFKGEKTASENVILKDFNFQIIENKKEKNSTINFTASNFQKVTGISIQITNKLYSRNATLFINKTEKIKKQTRNFRQTILNFVLSSNSTNSIELEGFFEKNFSIEIENNDNQPLSISTINVLQKPLYLISDLKMNSNYKLIIDSTLSKPQYDLEGFIKESTKDYPKVTLSNLQEVSTTQINASYKPFWQSKAFMWMCIVFAIAIIGYFAVGLLQDMKKE